MRREKEAEIVRPREVSQAKEPASPFPNKKKEKRISYPNSGVAPSPLAGGGEKWRWGEQSFLKHPFSFLLRRRRVKLGERGAVKFFLSLLLPLSVLLRRRGEGAAKTTQVARRRRQERRDQKKRVPTRRRKTDVGKSRRGEEA